MKNEITIEENLFYLWHLLIDLDYYRFDEEITKQVKELKEKVEEKLWSKLNEVDLQDYEIIFRYKLDKKSKK